MALPQRDNFIDEIKRTDALLEYAVMHGDIEEAERLREKLKRLALLGETDASSMRLYQADECRPVWDGKN